MQIRVMTHEDIPACQALWQAVPGMGLNPADDSEAGLGRFLQRNPCSCFVAHDAAEGLVGTILCGHDGRRGSVYHLCVAPHARGQHIGEALVQSALQALRAEGITKVSLPCFKHNEVGNGFWQRQGWMLREDLNLYQMVIKP